MNTLVDFSPFLTREPIFVTYLLSCTPVPFLKGAYSKRKAFFSNLACNFRVDLSSEGSNKICSSWKCINIAPTPPSLKFCNTIAKIYYGNIQPSKCIWKIRMMLRIACWIKCFSRRTLKYFRILFSEIKVWHLRKKNAWNANPYVLGKISKMS